MSGQTLRILHTNDLHGTLSDAVAARLAEFRADADLYVDTGDAVKAGNLAIPVSPDPVWPRLADLRCTASVPGNREAHLYEYVMRLKLAGLAHPMLCANLRHVRGEPLFPSSAIVPIAGWRVGLMAAMVPMVTERTKTKAAATLRWTAPIDALRSVAEELRPQVDVLIALTHIGLARDRELAATIPAIDIICGGHSHDVLQEPELVGRTWIVQGGSHARYVGRYEWREGALTGGLVPLRSAAAR
ncbi:MAG: metallophosphoesterase [Fimbriimonadaceae bacterium]|nr:metallophosphoesterase [Fimbriimonadaceae bacterium]